MQTCICLPEPIVRRLDALAFYWRKNKQDVVVDAAKAYIEQRRPDGGGFTPLDTRLLPERRGAPLVKRNMRIRPDESNGLRAISQHDNLPLSTVFQMALERYIANVGGRTMAEAERVYASSEAL